MEVQEESLLKLFSSLLHSIRSIASKISIFILLSSFTICVQNDCMFIGFWDFN